MDEEEGITAIIIDNGSGYFKAGFSGEEKPSTILPSIVGYPNFKDWMKVVNKTEFFIGDKAKENRGVLNYFNPIKRGTIIDWDNIEKIYKFILDDELRSKPKEHNIMITEPLMNPRKNREKLAQIMFETFNIPGLFFENTAVLNLFASGKFTGFSVDSGEGLTQYAPIFEGYLLTPGLMQVEFGGEDITNFLLKMLFDNGEKLSPYNDNNEKKIVEDIKEKSCYVTLKFEDELKSCKPFNYELPDGNQITLKEERIKCSEILFEPSIIGEKGNGLAKACYDLIQKCSIDVKKELYHSICLSGGNTMFNGFPERFEKEIKSLVPNSMKDEVKINATKERKFHQWIGGSIISSISTMDSKWITKNNYEENGLKIIK